MPIVAPQPRRKPLNLQPAVQVHGKRGKHSAKLGRKLAAPPPKKPVAGKPTAQSAKSKPSTTKTQPISQHTLAWWNNLSQQEQAAYIKLHPKTKLKLRTNKSGTTGKKLSRPRLAGQLRRSTKQALKYSRVSGKPAAKKSAAPIKSAPTAKQHWRWLHKLFKHARQSLLRPQGTNRMVQEVERHLNKRQHDLLNKAKTFAKAHPELDKPPHHLRKALTRVMLFAVLAGAGAALAGPAGAFMVANALNNWKGGGGGLDRFAWNALRGRTIDGEQDEEYDENERPVVTLIKSLKYQLANTQAEADREHIQGMLEDLEDQLDRYSTLKEAGLTGIKPDNSHIPHHSGKTRHSGKTGKKSHHPHHK